MAIEWNKVGSSEGRFSLHEDGQITWQDNKTNPLPGDAVAMIKKGDTVLSPEVFLIETDDCDHSMHDELREKTLKWLQSYIQDVLAPLFRLVDQTENKLEGSAKDIGDKLYENLGVIHRSEIEHYVPALTPEFRATLRSKKVKMGPILVFMYELVKPAAVNLRALLWGVWNEKTLPVERPADGRVSVSVDPKAVDRHYLRSIGYPVFGTLAIRIDMLDRVVTDIYDSSKDFKFQAQHKYMEWLGCGEEDLYGVLQSMGFRKIHENTTKSDDSEQAKIPESVENTENTENADHPETQEKQTEEKPELAMFWLKKGKISDRPASKPRQSSQKPSKKQKDGKKQAKKERFQAKTYRSEAQNPENDDNSPFSILKTLK